MNRLGYLKKCLQRKESCTFYIRCDLFNIERTSTKHVKWRFSPFSKPDPSPFFLLMVMETIFISKSELGILLFPESLAAIQYDLRGQPCPHPRW